MPIFEYTKEFSCIDFLFGEFYNLRKTVYMEFRDRMLRRVQITSETSTNITRYLYSSHSPDGEKD